MPLVDWLRRLGFAARGAARPAGAVLSWRDALLPDPRWSPAEAQAALADPRQRFEWTAQTACHAVIRALCATPEAPAPQRTPHRIMQYWHAKIPPPDVLECMETWRATGIPVHRFDDQSAVAWLARHATAPVREAFEMAHHPSMRADLFRLAFLLHEGGMYVDADDGFEGSAAPRFPQGLTMLAQGILHGRVVPVEEALAAPAEDIPGFYVNNAPLHASPHHPAIALALTMALENIAAATSAGAKPDIHRDTGPSNLTAAVVRHALDGGDGLVLRSLRHWSYARMFLPLLYKQQGQHWGG